MKNKNYILGLITTGILFGGILYKVQHWPGAAILLTVGTFMTVFVFLPLALRDNYKAYGNKENRSLYIVTWLTCFVVFTSMLFKIQHWPGAGYGLLISLLFPYVVFLPVFLVVTSRNKNFNIHNTVFVLLLLAANSAIAALLALNVSKEMTADSLKITGNYNKVEIVLDKVTVKNDQSPVVIKIDEALRLVDEYQELIFRNEGITREQLNNDPEILMEPGYRKAQKARSFSGREGQVHGELQAALSDMIVLAESDPGLKALAPGIKTIFRMEHSRGEGYIFSDPLFKSDVRPWVHAYLDGLETNLKMIRVAL
jgi:hypothetical protein